MYYIGIDLGGTNIAVGIVDENHEIIAKGSTPTLANREPGAILDDMAKACADVIAEAGLTVDDIEYAGIATPGTADHDAGVVVYANNLPFLNYPLSDELKKRIPFKAVYIENDANAAALGEAVAGAAKGTTDSIMITLGTGVGGGIIIDGKVYSGFNYAAAELGHMMIVANGNPCSCGLNGCWEAYSSATALIKSTREAMERNPDTVMWEMCEGNLANVNGRTAFNAMRQGDMVAAEVIDMYIEYLAVGIINIINIFCPEVLSIGGGISNEKDRLLDMLLPRIGMRIYSSNSPRRTLIKIAELGNEAGIIGAAALRA